jgi:predicted PurR-regulated permease PerM
MLDSPPPLAGQPRIPARPTTSTTRLAQSVTVIAFIIAALYFGRDVFVPLALGILLSFVLAPLVRLLRRAYFGRVGSVLAAVAFAFAIIIGLGALIGGQLTYLAENLPQYEGTLRQKIRSIQDSTSGNGLLGRASAVLHDLANEVAGANQIKPPPAAAAQHPPVTPIPVEIVQPTPTPLALIESVAGPLLQPLATAGLVLIFTIFILLQREDLRDRVIRLLGVRDLQRTTNALDDAAERLSRYFLVQGALNACFGIIIATGLWWIGVPNPALWGIIAAMLRFLPYVGAPLAAVFPALIAVAVAPGWSMMLWTLALFVVVEPLMGQLVEPLLYGHSTGLSSLAIVLSATFWTSLWGPIGLLLATPLTVCLVVLGRHVERLEILDIVLGDQPALTPPESFYQRLLAGNVDEALEQAEAFLRDHSLADFYDEVVLRALVLVQRDSAHGRFDEAGLARLHDQVMILIEELAEHEDPDLEASAAEPAAREGAVPVLCVATRSAIDEIASTMLAQLLRRRGLAVAVLGADQMSALSFRRAELGRPEIVCLSYFGCDNLRPARYAIRRLHRRLPETRMLLGLWCLDEAENAHNDALTVTGADGVAGTLRQTVAYVTVTSASPHEREGSVAPDEIRQAIA